MAAEVGVDERQPGRLAERAFVLLGHAAAAIAGRAASGLADWLQEIAP